MFLSGQNNNVKRSVCLPALPFLSFRFHDCRRDGETRNLVPGTNERNVPSGRREFPAHVAGPRPECSIPYITPGPPVILLPRNLPSWPRVRAGRNTEFHDPLLRAQHQPCRSTEIEHRALKFVHAFILIILFFFFYRSTSSLRDNKSMRIPLQSCLTVYVHFSL